MRYLLANIFLLCTPFLVHAADWGDIATISKTVTNYACTHDGGDLNCKPDNPYIDASGNVSASGYVSATSFYGDGSTLSGISADDADTLDFLDSLQFLRSDADDTYTGTLTLTGQMDTTSLTVDTNTLFVDSTNNRVGVGTDIPQTMLEVAGTISATIFEGALPAGTVLMFAKTTCPAGWSEMTAARGLFIRGYGDGTNTYDPDGSTRTVGSTVQTESYASHNHTASSNTVSAHSHAANPASFNATAASNGAHTHTTNPASVTSGGQSATHTHNVNPAAKTFTSDNPGTHTHGWSVDKNTNNTEGGGGGSIKEVNNGAAGSYDRTTGGGGVHTHSITFDIAAKTSGNASQGHTHNLDLPATTSSSNGAHTHTVAVDVPNTTSTAAGGHSHSITVGSSSGAETRPVNIALLFCQKD